MEPFSERASHGNNRAAHIALFGEIHNQVAKMLSAIGSVHNLAKVALREAASDDPIDSMVVHTKRMWRNTCRGKSVSSTRRR